MKQDFPFDPSTVLLPGLQDRPIDAPGGTFHLPTTTFGDPRAFRSQGYTNFSVHKGFSKGSKINPGWPRSLSEGALEIRLVVYLATSFQ